MLHHSVQQIAGVHTMNSRNRNWLAQAQLVKINNFINFGKIIHLIYAQYHWLATTPQKICRFLVLQRQPSATVRHENNHVRFLNSNGCLLQNPRQNLVVLISKINAAGVNHRKITVQPSGVTIKPVPRYARHILHNSVSGANQAVKQRAFAHVGPPHNSNNRLH